MVNGIYIDYEVEEKIICLKNINNKYYLKV